LASETAPGLDEGGSAFSPIGDDNVTGGGGVSAGQNDGRALRRPRFAYIRWTILGLFVLAMVLNYLSRSVLGVAAPMVLSEQSISSEQYSWITSAFQLGVMFQPLPRPVGHRPAQNARRSSMGDAVVLDAALPDARARL
jgi:hypothetical protein